MMKYFSKNAVEQAYDVCADTTTNKFWGLLAIFTSIDSQVIPCESYTFRVCDVSETLDRIFNFGDKKVYDQNTNWGVIFSKNWIDFVSKELLTQRPNIFDIIVWYYRNRAFEDNVTDSNILSLFLEETHLSIEVAVQLFDFSQKKFEFDRQFYGDNTLFIELSEKYGNNSGLKTISMDKNFVVACPSELSRAPFVQPLYAGQGVQQCLILTQFSFKELYQADNNMDTADYNSFLPLQKIVYGAPGTGKSFGTDDKIHKIYSEGSEEEKNYVFRTTFHPDSDYATFVGAYKPTKVKAPKYKYTIDELKLLFMEYKEKVSTRPEIRFAGCYYKDLQDLSKDDWRKIFEGSQDTVIDSEIGKGIVAAEAYSEAHKTESTSITYEFVPQAFTKAYVAAWKSVLKGENKDVFLVIEEINRGNCAQIFGDLFQLLDRKENGRSRYQIKPDTDLGNYINEQLGKLVDSENEDKAIARGEEMVLPPNLHIWATMNTSDQSLFPMDSAFKRRWDWEYVPIRYRKDNSNTNSNDNFDTFKITIGNEHYLWVEFLKQVNDRILKFTESEDKQMGEYFIKGDIDEKSFINKVMFYLWSEVGKDMYKSSKPFFKSDENREFAFNELFKDDATNLLKGFMKVLEVTSVEETNKQNKSETEELGNQ